MKNQVEITTNTGKSRMVSKEFAEAFNKSKKRSKSLPKNFGELNEVPIEEFEEENNVEKSLVDEVLNKPKKENQIKGGLADKMSVEDIAKKHNVEVNHIKSQIRMGLKVEMEHTDDPRKALEIAMDHMVESPDYYTKLKEMEESFED